MVLNKTVLLLSVYICVCCSAYARKSEICLVKGKDTVAILPHGKIGFITNSADTIKYDDLNGLWYEIESITTDSVIVKRPLKYHDTIMQIDNHWGLVKHKKAGEYREIDEYRKNRTRWIESLLITSYEYKRFATKDIVSFQYPPEIDNTTGCTVCILVYPLVSHKLAKRYIPYTYSMKRWRLVAATKMND